MLNPAGSVKVTDAGTATGLHLKLEPWKTSGHSTINRPLAVREDTDLWAIRRGAPIKPSAGFDPSGGHRLASSAMTAAELTVPDRLNVYDKLRILGACVLAAVFMRTVGWMVAQPLDPREAILLAMNERGFFAAALAALPILLLLTAVVTALGTVIVGRVVPEAGVFVAGIGLAALALRGGSIHVLLAYYLDARGDEPARLLSQLADERRSLMVRLAMDCLLWSAVMAVSWGVMSAVRKWLWTDESPQPASGSASKRTAVEPAGKPGWMALAITGVVAGLVIWLTIARTPVAVVARGQVIAAVAAGLFAGAYAARYYTGVADARWYLLAPPAVGLVAYLLGYLNAEMRWAPGEYRYYALLPTTPPHNLVRALPIEYIAVGVSATLAGYWFGQRTDQPDGQEHE